MKNYDAIGSPTDLKKFYNISFISALILISLLSCTDVHLDELSRESLAAKQQSAEAEQKRLTAARASTSTSITEIQFTATALIADCHGENITFTGTIQNRVTTTTDAEGVIHYSRSFNTRGLTALGVPSGTEYNVIGGAEMFAIQDAVFVDGNLSLPASLSESNIVIHQGTLVFESRTDGSRVVARHIIQKVPGRDGAVSKWECQGD